MLVIFFSCLILLAAGSDDSDNAYNEYDEEEAPLARAAAAITSTDVEKEKDVILNDLKKKLPGFPHGPPGYPPMFPPGYPGEYPMPPFGPPGGHPGGHPGDLYPGDDHDGDEPDYDDLAAHAAAPFPPYGPFPPPPYCPDMCDLERYKQCTCLSPATFTKDGRGNCNVGASKLDLRVWCYIDPKAGVPEKICPDALPSKSKKGFYWSRIACITN